MSKNLLWRSDFVLKFYIFFLNKEEYLCIYSKSTFYKSCIFLFPFAFHSQKSGVPARTNKGLPPGPGGPQGPTGAFFLKQRDGGEGVGGSLVTRR